MSIVTEIKDRLRNLQVLIDEDIGIIKRLLRYESPPDEPDITNISAVRGDTDHLTEGNEISGVEGAAAMDDSLAELKAIVEVCERYCASIYSEDDIIYSTESNLSKPALETDSVVNYSKQQLDEGLPHEVYQKGDEIGWVNCLDLVSNDSILVPGQLTYLSYDYTNEPLLRHPISTGLAGGFDKESVLKRSILEIIERDAFIIYYLNEAELPTIQLPEQNKSISPYLDLLGGQQFDLTVLNATTDLEVPTVIVILEDPISTPTITVAANSSTDPITAITAGIEEVLQTRNSVIGQLSQLEEPLETMDFDPIEYENRQLFWARDDVADNLDFWTSSDRKIDYSTFITMERNDSLDDIIDTMTQFDYDVYAKDVTTSDVKQADVEVWKVIIPQMQPLYLDEVNKYLGGERLDTVPSTMGYPPSEGTKDMYNQTPHPFP